MSSCTSVVDSVVDVVVSSEVDSAVDVVPAVMSESSVIIFPIENGHGTVPNYAPQILQINGQFPFFYSFPQLEKGVRQVRRSGTKLVWM